jgi:hypothetical protein
MITAGVIILVALALIGAGIFMILFLGDIIKGVAKGVVGSVIGSAIGGRGGIRDRILDRALDVGERELIKGADAVGKMVSKEMLMKDSKRMATEATKHAKESNGELTVSSLMAAMEIPEELARKTLDDLMIKKICFRKETEEDTVYIFPGFKKKKYVKSCEYCDSNFDLDKAQNECPNCGAKLTISSVLT